MSKHSILGLALLLTSAVALGQGPAPTPNQPPPPRLNSFSDYYGTRPEVILARRTQGAPLGGVVLEALLSPSVPLAVKAAVIEVKTFPKGTTAGDVTALRQALSARYGDILVASNRERASADDLFVLGYLETLKFTDGPIQTDGLQLLGLASGKARRSATIAIVFAYEAARRLINESWCSAYRRFQSVDERIQKHDLNDDMGPEAVAWFVNDMKPYKAKCREQDTKLAELRSYGQQETQIVQGAGHTHDVAGLLITARKVGALGTDLACAGALDAVQAAARTLKGISFIEGAECVHFRLNYDWFQAMASSRGRAADEEFVRLYRRTFPDSETFAFEDRNSDVGACAKYGSGLMSDLYLAWRAQSTKYPNMHAADVSDVMTKIVKFLAPEYGCACNDSTPGIVSELEHFLEAAASDPASASVKHALRELKDESESQVFSHWKLDCVPG